jgi:type VI secretion system secreted protein VgrG
VTDTPLQPVLAGFEFNGSELPDGVFPVAFRAREAVSEPFDFRVEFSHSTELGDDPVDLTKCLRSAMSLAVFEDRDASEARYFHGVCEEIRYLRSQGTRHFYEVRLVPSLYALGHRQDCRIFQDMTVVDILEKLLEEAGIRDHVVWDKIGDFAPLEFTVQYRETTLNFFERLLEDHGLFYFFEHTREAHTLVIADHKGAFRPLDSDHDAHLSLTTGVAAAGSIVQRLQRTVSLRTAQVELRDFDFKKPGVPPSGEAQAEAVWPHQHYDYPSGFLEGPQAKSAATTRLRQLRHDADVLSGQVANATLRVGRSVTFGGHIEEELNTEVVCVELETRGRHDPSSRDLAHHARASFRAVPAGVEWKPRRKAHRPRIAGLHTAIVTGDSAQDQAIHVDEHGRVKVRFYWDRVSQQNGTSSCWIRVNQLALGGSMILPRIGWELSIAFLEGNPDRPVALGKFYNATHLPPQGLPGAKASSSMKSMSTPGGAGHNSIGASDTGGSQGLGIHAQKDINMVTGGDWTENVGVDDVENITKNVSLSVAGTETIEVGGDQSLNVGCDITTNIAADQTTTIGGSDDSNCTADLVEEIGGARSYTVGGMATTINNSDHKEIQGDLSRTVGAVHLIASVASITDNIVGSRTTTVGAVRALLSVGGVEETVGAGKTQTSLAAEVHVTRGNNSTTSKAAVTSMVGAIHYQKITGDYVVKSPMITLLGAVADIAGGSSSLKLGGGPIVMKGSKIALDAPLIIRLGATLKLA